MSGFDGRGPIGSGPMTGGGRGYCVLVQKAVATPPVYGPQSNRFFPRPRFGLGLRRGRDGRGGRGRRFWW